MKSLKQKLNKLPKTPGVYYFYDKKGELLYIGKASSLKSRVGSYFLKISQYAGKTQVLVEKIADIKIKKTDSVLEALILEANEIKKYLPPYNIRAKDDKTFVDIVITKEEFSRVLIVRPTEDLKYEIKKVYGPYTSAKSAREAIKILRKIFPFHSRNEKSEKKCLDFHIGLCPGPYVGAISKKDYAKNIRCIEMVLQGKKKGLIGNLEKEMKKLSREKKYEDAAGVRNKIFALRHIRDVALISTPPILPSAKGGQLVGGGAKRIVSLPAKGALDGVPHRIEAYDISNISGKYAVGSMVVFEDGEIAKDEYRKFKIKTVKETNDVGMLKEVLERRLNHKEWIKPDLILIDGGKGQVNGAVSVANKVYPPLPPLIKGGDKKMVFAEGDDSSILIVGVAKGPTRKKLDLYSSDDNAQKSFSAFFENKKLVAHIMGEAHRFAISYHRMLRQRGMK